MPKPNPARESLLQDALNALSNPHRLRVLIWLADPEQHFPKQQDADLVADGVCVSFITEKLGLSQPTVTTHMQALAKAGLVTSKKIKNWVYYRPDGAAIDRLLGDLRDVLKRA
ncbi:ArsR/SmtB family transcription factor [Burkholderia sp. Ac-20379]|uniref:ArsR/SmtB family transcription factor n=1 Tax=Burkholderia sp. Ac-20379 TaxID=2703900 RepID=UPI00197E981B|nr:metalloregulator ArsR/SmtB family transcription factor [Burkholderia sp. Ac-20379]MBN3723654.1 helix-turn-helix transcriptional regulator [Burkholderia sp. Ac-20379]